TSSAQDAPRGLEFLLSANRLNVAISRRQWASILVRSRALTRCLPPEPGALRELGGFIGLCQRALPRRPRHHLPHHPRPARAQPAPHHRAETIQAILPARGRAPGYRLGAGGTARVGRVSPR